VTTPQLKQLSAVQDQASKTRIVLIRLAWPEVKAALNRGHSLKAIHQRLTHAGIDITYRRLSQCVTRLRREEKQLGAPRSNAGKISAPSKQSVDSGIADVGGERHDAHNPGAIDALADYRKRTAKARAFKFEPGLPDEGKLI
jgi:hypothetical protein